MTISSYTMLVLEQCTLWHRLSPPPQGGPQSLANTAHYICMYRLARDVVQTKQHSLYMHAWRMCVCVCAHRAYRFIIYSESKGECPSSLAPKSDLPQWHYSFNKSRHAPQKHETAWTQINDASQEKPFQRQWVITLFNNSSSPHHHSIARLLFHVYGDLPDRVTGSGNRMIVLFPCVR